MVEAWHKQDTPPVGRRRPALLAATTAVLSVSVFVVAGWFLGVLLDPRAMPIRVVQVEGRFHHLTPRQLQDAVGQVATGGILSVDVGAIKARARSVAWVEAVTVRRVWPDSLVLSVVERAPETRWGRGGLLTPAGLAFYPATEEIPQTLVQLDGPAGSEQRVLEQYRTLRAVLQPYDLEIASLTLDERRSWSLTLVGGPELRLGRADAVARLRRFAPVYVASLKARAAQIRVVDLRYTNGFAVGWVDPDRAARNGRAGWGGRLDVEKA